MSDEFPAPRPAAACTAVREDARRRLDAEAAASGEDVSAEEARLFEALGPALDPRDAGDAGRILRHLTSCRLPSPTLGPFLADVAETAVDSELRGLSTLVCGKHALLAGRFAEATRRIRGALAASRGSGTRVERIAGLACARLALQLRSEFEALVLARRAISQMDEAGDLWGGVSARAMLCAAYSLIGDVRRLAEGLDDLAPRIPRVDPVRRTIVESVFHARRAEVLLAQGRLEEALESLRAMKRIGGRALEGDRRWSVVLEADVLFVLGRFADCESRLSDAAARGPANDAAGLRVRTRRLRLDVCRGVPTVVDDAVGLLEDLERRAGADVGPAARRELALQIAETLGFTASALPVARRAYDLAAASSFERLVELDRFVREVPESSRPTREDLEVLEEFRRRTLSAQRETYQAVARLLASAALEGRSPAPMLVADDHLTCVCAWCQRVRTTDGFWLSIQQFLPLQLEGPIQLTHGICESCLPGLRGQALAATQGEHA